MFINRDTSRKSLILQVTFAASAEESDSFETTGDEDAPPDYEQVTKGEAKGKGSKNVIKNIVRKKHSVEGRKREDSSTLPGGK